MKMVANLLREPVEDVDQFSESLARFVFAQIHAGGNTRVDVVFENGQTDPVESGLGRCQLLKDFNAQARFLNHAPNASDLSLDPVQPGDEGLLLRVIKHGSQLRSLTPLQPNTAETEQTFSGYVMYLDAPQ